MISTLYLSNAYSIACFFGYLYNESLKIECMFRVATVMFLSAFFENVSLFSASLLFCVGNWGVFCFNGDYSYNYFRG